MKLAAIELTLLYDSRLSTFSDDAPTGNLPQPVTNLILGEPYDAMGLNAVDALLDNEFYSRLEKVRPLLGV